jgi:hypothetical protein
MAALAFFRTTLWLGAMRAAVFLAIPFHSLTWRNTALTAWMGTGFSFHSPLTPLDCLAGLMTASSRDAGYLMKPSKFCAVLTKMRIPRSAFTSSTH